MAVMTFDLKHGYKVGESTHLEVGLRELSSGDYIDAQLAAEKVVVIEGRPMAYTSDVMYGLELMIRQIEYVGAVQGFSVKELRKLHQDDFNLIQQKTSELDQLIAQELEDRGR
jgi:phage FluMu protein gp41